jgi:hypothetical protein
MTASEQVLEKLAGVRPVGLDKWSARCPAHDDEHASLTVAYGAEGRVLVRCHAGCSVDAIVAAIGLTVADLFPRNGHHCARVPRETSRTIVATYDYVDERGELLFQVCRFDPKHFSQRRPRRPDDDVAALRKRGVRVDTDWVWSLNGVRRVLYRLPALLSADPATTVHVVEGERDVHALEALGLLATTNPGGAGKWQPEYTEILRARHVVILPDNDEPGRKHADHVRRMLDCVAATVRVVNLPGLPDKGDVSDWASAGGTRNALEALVAGVLPSHPSSISPVESVEWDDVAPWPVLERAALHGLAGELVTSLDPHTEADPVAVLITTLILFGNAIGDRAHVGVGGVRHPARLFACIVGETSRARKGQSFGDTAPFFATTDPTWWDAARESGLSSGEGIVARLRDTADGTLSDKRAVFIEPEFARTLAAAQREKSTLSAILRDAWDSGRLRVLTRVDPLRATGAHVSILAHITRDELRERLTSTEIGNGFANRFLFLAVRRSKKLPNGGALPERVVPAIAQRLRLAIETARTRDVMRRTPAAEARWAIIYDTLPEPPGLFGAITARAEAHLVRLALVYALLDGAAEIDVPHLEAALAVWRYAEASAAHLFRGVLGSDTADRLLVELRAVYPAGLDGVAQSQLFARHKSEAELEAARVQLATAHLAVRRREAPERGIGRPRDVLYAVPRAAKEANEAKEAVTGGLASHVSLISHPTASPIERVVL